MDRAARRPGHPSQTLRGVGSALGYKCTWLNESPESAQAFRSWRSTLAGRGIAAEPSATRRWTHGAEFGAKISLR
jgi:hypothetical protein